MAEAAQAVLAVLAVVATLGVAAGVAVPGPASAAPVTASAAGAADGSSRTLLVRFAPGAPAAARDRVLSAHGLRPSAGTARDAALARIGWTAARAVGAAPLEDVRARILTDVAVSAAEVEGVRTASSAADPSDPLARKGRQRYLDAARFPEAWARRTGTASPVIAVVDSGVDHDHPDLRDRLLAGIDFVNDDDDASDDAGHGTSVAGVAAAVPDNAVGLTGAAWSATVLPVKVLDATGSGVDADVAAGIVWAADRGAAVVNVSLGGPTDAAVLRDAVTYAISKGALVVAGSGNGGRAAPVYPAAIPAVVAVTATDWSGNVASISDHGDWVDLAAPGLDIAAPTRSSRPSETYGSVSGTSYSAALVSAAAALVRAQQPTLTPAQVAARLVDTARDTGPHGVDPFSGAGVLDAGAALGAAARPPANPPADASDGPDRSVLIPVTSTSPHVNPSGTATGTISPEGDEDWFSFDVPASGFYGITVQPPEALAFGSSDQGWRQERAEHLDVAIEIFGPDLRKLLEHDEEGDGRHEYIRLSTLLSGRHHIRVRNTFPSRSPGDYSVQVERAELPAQRLTEFQPYDLASRAESVAIGDVTGDGRNDVLLTTGIDQRGPNDLRLSVFSQQADGWLALTKQRSLPEGDTPYGVTAADLDGDGRTDAAVATASGVVGFLQRSGTIAAGAELFAAPGALQVEAADLNGDGTSELLVATRTALLVARRSGTTWSTTTIGRTTVDIGVGDVTGDGRPDVVAAEETTLRVHAQRSDGGFAAPVAYVAGVEGAGDRALSLAVGDFTGDGRRDVAVSSPFCWRPCLHVHPQIAAGTLGPVSSRHALEGLEPLRAADVDRDGRTDLVSAHGGWDNVGVHLQTTSGTLADAEYDAVPQASHYRSTGLAVGDVTGDGAVDIVTANSNHGLVVLRQVTPSWPRAAHAAWLRQSTPPDGAAGVPTSTAPAVRFGRAVDAATLTTTNVRLVDGTSGAVVATSLGYDTATRTATLRPTTALASNRAYRIEVRGLRDAAGEALSAPMAIRFRTTGPADTTAPDTRIVGGPSGVTSVDIFGSAFAVTASEPGARYECRLHTVEFYPCAPPFLVNPNYPGDFRFSVRAIDAAGNVDATPAERTWTAVPGDYPPNDDTDSPTDLTGSSGTVSGTTLHASWQGRSEPVHGGNAGGDASVWYRWIAPATGSYAFHTTGSTTDTLLGAYTWSPDPRALDPLLVVEGNDDTGSGTTSRITFHATGGTEYMVAVATYFDEYHAATGAFTLGWTSVVTGDTAPPETSITAGPSGTTSSTSARFEFRSSEAASTFRCRLDSAAESVCTSPHVVHGLTAGDHRLLVTAVDPSGNADPTPAVRTWTVGTGTTTTSTTSTSTTSTSAPTTTTLPPTTTTTLPPTTTTSTSTTTSTTTTTSSTTSTTSTTVRPTTTTSSTTSTTSTTVRPTTTTTTSPTTSSTTTSSTTSTSTTVRPTTTTSSTTTPPTTTTSAPAPTVQRATDPTPPRSGYWMVGADGAVHAFGDAPHLGNAPVGATPAVDLEPTATGGGYWVADAAGHVFAFGDAPHLGGAIGLAAGESVTSISAVPGRTGYWLFTTRGRVIAFGDAPWLGDMSLVRLNGPVLDSVPTPSGAGYYMVASDGGIFTFGDAEFRGSMGDVPLNQPVQSLVPDRDGGGYWLVASDGGIFAFDAEFHGSMGDTRLNQPVTGMVGYRRGYLMVATDGGIFTFGDAVFSGSLGDAPPSRPIVAVAPLPS